MFKTLIAGVTALSLTVTSAEAQDFNNDDFGKFLFGLVAVAVLGTALSKDRETSKAVPVHQPRYAPPVVQQGHGRIAPARPPVFNPRVHEPSVVNPRGHGYGGVRNDRVLPGQCFFTAQTRFGPQNMFGYGCLQKNYRSADSLPARCEVRLIAEGGPRRGYDPLCLREAGYTSTRRH